MVILKAQTIYEQNDFILDLCAVQLTPWQFA